MKTLLTRRTLLKGSLVAGAGLAIGFPLAGRIPGALAQTAGVFAPNQWLRIDRDGVVTIINSVPEMGQGSLTTTPMIIADELDAVLDKVRVEQAPANPALYKNPVTGTQSYGGSRGVRDHIAMWRKAAAAAREMLKQAAASEWGVPVESVDTEAGTVIHRPTGRRLPYGQLVDKAQHLPVPENPKLKTPDQFRYIGKTVKRRDTPEKVTGRAIYGMDVKVPGMLVASIERCPVFGGKAKSFDATATRAVKGVKQVVQVSNGVAVVAAGFWPALQGRRALKVEWDEGPIAQVSSAMINREYESAAQQPGQVARNDGDAEKVLAAGGKVHEAVYQVPFLEHACMEPMNATAHVRADACTIWVPTQNPGATQATAARLTGLPPDKITVHTTLLGGGFGRRGEVDFVIDAVEVAKAVGVPVKVMWTREDDITHGFYRPATYNVFQAALDGNGMPSAWFTRMIGPGILIQKGRAQAGTIDAAAVEAMRNMPYDVPNLRVEWTNKDFGIPVGFWRSVGASQNGFIVEGFIDELAHLAGKDPVEYRRALLGKSLRHKAVLELVAAKANWGAPLRAGVGRGCGVVFSYGSYAASVAEVSVAPDGTVLVHRLVCGIDAGFAVNPDAVRAQMEGGAVYALTATFYGQITIDKGRVQQSNFHDYPMLRINEMPKVEVHILDSGEAPGGLGEPGVPSVAPAVCNAIFAATGKRVRRLPINKDELKRA
ncbi:MAG TPA: xanthine dehydrogenase family protein molybdopterin-binding subunit [Methylomirabilota bacterium]|jgi:isoquinoline 1-oxidoreductase beta subunit|nr:xanthine dehydrogenase family protein molybdopterin-binding subunit [Methylomirabilota bacterium]